MTCFKRLVLGVGLLGMADTALVLAIAGGINLGTLLPGTVGTLLVAWAMVTPRTKVELSFLHQWNLKAFAFLLGLVGLISFLTVQGLMLYYALEGANADSEGADWCIVLGAGLRGDNPSLTLRRRLDKALAVVREQPELRVVVSGGQGPGETISEAEAMRRWLLERGIAPARILIEDNATSTIENLRYSKEAMATAGAQPDARVIVVSNDFHLLRVRILARRIGLNAHTIAAPTPWYLLPNVCLREFFAIAKSFALDR